LLECPGAGADLDSHTRSAWVSKAAADPRSARSYVVGSPSAAAPSRAPISSPGTPRRLDRRMLFT
jgi:hypothetical protein